MDRRRWTVSSHVSVTREDRSGEPYALVECIIDYETFEVKVL